MEEEVRVILHKSVSDAAIRESAGTQVGLATRIHALFMDVEVPDEYFAAVEAIRKEPALARAAKFDG
jgi:hypothetical protein